MQYHDATKTPRWFTVAFLDLYAIAQAQFQANICEDNVEGQKMSKEQKEAMIQSLRSKKKNDIIKYITQVFIESQEGKDYILAPTTLHEMHLVNYTQKFTLQPC